MEACVSAGLFARDGSDQKYRGNDTKEIRDVSVK